MYYKNFFSKVRFARGLVLLGYNSSRRSSQELLSIDLQAARCGYILPRTEAVTGWDLIFEHQGPVSLEPADLELVKLVLLVMLLAY